VKETVEIKKDNGEDLEKVAAESKVKLMRHRADDYIAMILGIGFVLILWLLQLMGVY